MRGTNPSQDQIEQLTKAREKLHVRIYPDSGAPQYAVISRVPLPDYR